MIYDDIMKARSTKSIWSIKKSSVLKPLTKKKTNVVQPITNEIYTEDVLIEKKLVGMKPGLSIVTPKIVITDTEQTNFP